jgi:hypothetical protein
LRALRGGDSTSAKIGNVRKLVDDLLIRSIDFEIAL